MTDSSNTTNSLAHTKWNCKYHIVFAPKYRRKVFYEEHRMEVREILRKLCEWKGVETIEGEVYGHSREKTKAIQEYVANQLKVDKQTDQLSIFDPRDPLTGSKKPMHDWQVNKRAHLC